MRVRWHERLSLQSLALKMWLFKRPYHSVLFCFFSPSTLNVTSSDIFPQAYSRVLLMGFYHLLAFSAQKPLLLQEATKLTTLVFASFPFEFVYQKQSLYIQSC